MRDNKIYSLIQLGYEVKPPRIKIGTKFHAIFDTPEGEKMVDGHVIANNTIDFATLEPLYTIDTHDVDFIGRKVIIDNVPESYFL